MDLFRNSARIFQCPVLGCEASYSTGADLHLHISHQHHFLSNPPQNTIPHTNQPQTRPQHIVTPSTTSPQQVHLNSNAYNAQPLPLTPAQQRQLIAQAFPVLAQTSNTAQQTRETSNSNAYNAPSRSSNTSQGMQAGTHAYNTQPQPSNSSQRAQPAANAYRRQPSPLNSGPQPVWGGPQGSRIPGQPAMSPVTGMHPPASTQNQFAGPANSISNTATSPVNNPASISSSRLASQAQTANNTQRCIWPSSAVNLLKTLLIRHSLLALPLDDANRLRFSIVLKEFRKTNRLDFMGLSPGDPRMLTIFENKIIEVQRSTMEEMLNEQRRQSREAVRRRAPGFPERLTTSEHLSNQPTVVSPLATPPPTPVISNASKEITIKECWDSRNADDQIKIFRQLIQSAKDPKQMTVEWEKWNTEKQGKKRQASDAFGLGLVVERHFEQNSNKTLAFTPPVDDQGEDLDSMIERRLGEARLKRQREKETNELVANRKAEEEASVKRMKTAAP